MTTLRILTILFLPLLQVGILIGGLTFPAAYFYSALAGFIITDALVALFFKRNTPHSNILWYALPSLLLYLSSAGSLVVVEERYLITSILIAQALFQWLYVINLFFYLYRKERYQETSFWHITMSLHVLSFFNFAVALYGLDYYADYSALYLGIPLCLISALVFAQQIIISGSSARKHWQFWSLQTLLIAESIIILQWFPSPYVTKAFFLTIPFFLACQLGMAFHRKELQMRSALVTTTITIIMLLLVVISTRWR